MNKDNVDLEGGRILLVDDQPANLDVLYELLDDAGYRISVAPNGQVALKVVEQAVPDLILLDVMMPGMNGYEVCQKLKLDPQTRDIPVIFITAENQTEGVVAGFQAGGVDYIAKPFQDEEVLVRVQTHLRLNRLQRELAEKNQRLEEHSRELEEMHQKLEQAQAQLIAELEKELQTAHDLQMGLMPEEPPQVPGFEFAGRCMPANHVGGDFFNYYHLPQGRLAGVLADVTGHAMDAAIPLVQFSGILESQIRFGGSLEELVGQLNRLLFRTLPDHTFVCFTMGELDPVKRTLRLTNNACPYPYPFRAASGEVVELKLGGYPLGIRPDVDCQVLEVQLHPGDRLVFCSDGIVEAGNEDGEMFGDERTLESVRKGCEEDLSAQALLEQIIGDVKSFTGSTPQGDDQTIVVVRVGE